MQILTGRYSGFKLKPPPKGIRPTSGRVKESLFGIIQDRLDHAHVLDLFAGTGSLGLEAISAGASSCCFVDKSWIATSAVKSNIEKLAVIEKCQIINTSSQNYIKNIDSEPYHLIFLDPPYRKIDVDELVYLIYENQVITNDGLIVVESGLDEKFSETQSKIVRQEKYGNTQLTFFLTEEK